MADYFRALCARMADELDHYRQLLMDNRRETHALATEARAALAQPEPVGVTLANGEIQEWADSSWVVPLQEQRHDGDDWRICFTHEEFCDAIREALSRWGNPTIQPERDESVMDRLIAAPMNSRGYVDFRPGRTALAKPEPVGVTDEGSVPLSPRVVTDSQISSNLALWVRLAKSLDLLASAAAEHEVFSARLDDLAALAVWACDDRDYRDALEVQP